MDSTIVIPDRGGRDHWSLLQVEGNTEDWDNLYIVFETQVQHPDELGYIAIDDVAVLKGKCKPLSCRFQDLLGGETFCLWEQVPAGDTKDWILHQGPSPNYPDSGPLREAGDVFEYGCYNDSDATLMDSKWVFETNNSQAACLSFIRSTESPGNRYTGLRNGYKGGIMGELITIVTFRNECWGSTKLDQSRKIDNSFCQTACSGAETEYCGGENTVDVWLTGWPFLGMQDYLNYIYEAFLQVHTFFWIQQMLRKTTLLSCGPLWCQPLNNMGVCPLDTTCMETILAAWSFSSWISALVTLQHCGN